MQKDVQRWLKQADHDLEMAQKNEFPPRIHSFKRLTELLNLPQEILGEIIAVEKYYTALRYPDISERMPYENCDKEDAKMGIKKVKFIKEFVEGKLK